MPATLPFVPLPISMRYVLWLLVLLVIAHPSPGLSEATGGHAAGSTIGSSPRSNKEGTIAVSVATAGDENRLSRLRKLAGSVVVGIPAQRELLARVLGLQPEERHLVTVMYGGQIDIHTHEPSPSQLQKLARASHYFAARLHAEQQWKSSVLESNPALEWLEPPEVGGLDQHFWLSPPHMQKQTLQMQQILSVSVPESADYFAQNAGATLNAIDQLHRTLQSLFAAALPARTFVVQHPAWNWFAETYGLEQLSVEHEGKSLTPRRLASLIDTGKALSIGTLFSDPGHTDKNARIVAKALDAKLVTLQPLSDNWFEQLLLDATLIAEALR